MFDLEKRWIRRIQNNGHEASANKLIHKYYKEIFVYTYKQLFDQQLSMDLTQEIFIRTLQTIALFDENKASFRTWLYRIASNHCTDYFRSKAFQTAKHIDIVERVEVSGEDAVLKEILHKQQLHDIQQALATVDDLERQIVLGKLVDNLKFQQLADDLHVPLSTVKTKYYKGLKQLKQKLEVDYK